MEPSYTSVRSNFSYSETGDSSIGSIKERSISFPEELKNTRKRSNSASWLSSIASFLISNSKEGKKPPLKKSFSLDRDKSEETVFQKSINLFRSAPVNGEAYALQIFKTRINLVNSKANSTSTLDANIDKWYPFCLTTLQLYENFLERLKWDPNKLYLLQLIRKVTLNGLIPIDDLLDQKVQDVIKEIYVYASITSLKNSVDETNFSDSGKSLQLISKEFYKEYQRQYREILKYPRFHELRIKQSFFLNKIDDEPLSFRQLTAYLQGKKRLLLDELMEIGKSQNQLSPKGSYFLEAVQQFVNTPFKSLKIEFSSFKHNKNYSPSLFNSIFDICTDLIFIDKHALGCISPQDFIPTSQGQKTDKANKLFFNQLSDLSNRLKSLLLVTFLNFTNAEDQAKVLCFFYILLRELVNRHNFLSAFIIFSTLDTSVLKHFDQAWQIFGKYFGEKNRRLARYNTLFTDINNFENIKDKMQKLSHKNVSYIPYLPAYLHDLGTIFDNSNSTLKRQNFAVNELQVFERLMENIFTPFSNLMVEPLKTTLYQDLSCAPVDLSDETVDLVIRIKKLKEKKYGELKRVTEKLTTAYTSLNNHTSIQFINTILKLFIEYAVNKHCLKPDEWKVFKENKDKILKELILKNSQSFKNLCLFLNTVENFLVIDYAALFDVLALDVKYKWLIDDPDVNNLLLALKNILSLIQTDTINLTNPHFPSIENINKIIEHLSLSLNM